MSSMSTDVEPAPEFGAARAALQRALLEPYIARVVAEAPPLSPEQRDRLAVLLGPARPAPTPAPRPSVDEPWMP